MKKPFVHSFSAKKVFNQCPEKFHQDRVLRRFPFVQGPEAKEGDRLHRLLAEAFNRKALITGEDGKLLTPIVNKLRRSGDTLKAEIKFGIDKRGEACGYFGADVYYRVIVDLLRVSKDGSEAWIYDWKFGKDNYPDTDQLVENAICVFAAMPDVQTIHAKLVWPKTGKVESLSFSREYLDEYKEDLFGELSSIDAVMVDGLYSKIPGPLCPWCPIEECEFWRPKPNKG